MEGHNISTFIRNREVKVNLSLCCELRTIHTLLGQHNLWNCLTVVHHASVSAKISTSFTICRKTWIRKRAWGKLKSFGYLDTRLSIVLICYWWICVGFFLAKLYFLNVYFRSVWIEYVVGFNQLWSVLRLIVTSINARIRDTKQLGIAWKSKSRLLNFMQTSPIHVRHLSIQK